MLQNQLERDVIFTRQNDVKLVRKRRFYTTENSNNEELTRELQRHVGFEQEAFSSSTCASLNLFDKSEMCTYFSSTSTLANTSVFPTNECDFSNTFLRL